MEQESLIKSFNVFDLLTLTQEQAFQTINNIAIKLGITVKKTDLKDIFVANHRDKRSSHITGTFYEEKKRDEFFSNTKNRIADKNPLVEEICTLSNDSTFRGIEVRVRTKFTQHTREMLAKARQLSNKFSFIWESEGKILLRKVEDSRIIQIKSERQLADIATQQLPNNPQLQRNYNNTSRM